MRRSPLAAVLAAAALLALTGCATAPAAEPTRTTAESQPTPTATPTPTVETLVVAPGEQPPAVFDGDCAAVIPVDVLSAAVGYPIEDVNRREAQWTRSVNGVGGLSCEWRGGRIEVIPRSGLGEAVLPLEAAEYYFERCEHACSWLWETDSLWISGADWATEGRTRAEVDAIGGVLGAAVAQRWEAAGDVIWERDRTGWWPAIECEQLAAAVGDELGAALTGRSAGYGDPPGAATIMSEAAMASTSCDLSSGDEPVAVVRTHAGQAWSVPSAFAAQLVDLDVDGVEAYTGVPAAFIPGETYELTDGVNLVTAEVSTQREWAAEQIATALAAAAASGFQ